MERVYALLHNAYGVEPIVYTTPSFYENTFAELRLIVFGRLLGFWPFWKPIIDLADDCWRIL